MRNEIEEKAIKMLRKGKSINEVSLTTGLSAYWLSMVANREKI